MTLELHSDVTEELDPLLMVSFPGSVVNENLKLSYERVNGSSWKSQLSAETRELVYSGSNYGRNSHNQNTCQWLVGVADSGTDTISLHPVSHTFALRSNLKVCVYMCGLKNYFVDVYWCYISLYFICVL